MSLARGESVREAAPEVARPKSVAPAIESAPNLLLGLQRTVGNSAVCRFLARQPAPARTPGATPVAKVGTVSGKRPAITETSKTFDCNAAVAWINSGVYTGERSPVYRATARKIRHKKLPDAQGARGKTVKATGSNPQDATTKLQNEVNTYHADAQTAIDTATTDYDTLTEHGATQSAAGGVDVHLACL